MAVEATIPSANVAAKPTRAAAVTAAIRLVPEILDAARWGQSAQINALSEQLAQSIEASHPAIAKHIRRTQRAIPAKIKPCPDGLIDVRRARLRLQDVILPEVSRKACEDVLEEHRQRDALAAWALDPRHKVLLFGPPGNGKTTLAEALATEMDVPFLVVRYGGLVASYLGRTAENIDKVFDFASSGPCVLFLDEVDGIGSDRTNANEVGEMRRVTNQLLIAIENLPSHVLLVCATNAKTLVDGALLRRFDTQVELPAPSDELRLRCAEAQLAPDLCNGVDLRSRATEVAATVTENLDALVKRCREIRREHAIREFSRLTCRSGTDG